MSGFRDLAKGGWHPKGKDGGKESFRGDFKGVNQVAGWMGKGKSTSAKGGGAQNGERQHHSAPLSALKDPALFGPPPKHVHAHGASAATPQRSGPTLAASNASGEAEEPAAEEQYYNEEGYEPEFETPAPPTVAHRAAAPVPSLPPRLHSRTTPQTAASHTNKTGTNSGYINEAAANRLGQAGVSVPGLNIGHAGTAANGTSQAQMSELQSRFAGLKKPTSPVEAASQAQPSQGTSWSQKQGALQTAANFRKDPSSVSLSDARSAASTANNFRQRHGDQVAQGYRAAEGLNQKYNSPTQHPGTVASSVQPEAVLRSLAAKKAPPPPPPKKKNLLVGSNGQSESNTAPPIPLSSRPT